MGVDVDRDLISGAARTLIVGMTRLQRADGHWSTNVRSNASGIENSTAAFMAVGFRRAIRQNLFATEADLAAAVSRAADRAHTAVLGSLTGEGTLGVSAAVMACTTGSHYEHVPVGFVAPWGQGPVALMLAETDTDA